MSTWSGAKRVARDVTDLLELQLQLLKVDGAKAARHGTVGVVALGSGAVLALAGFTTLCIAGGWAFHEGLDWPVSVGLLVSGLIAFVLAIVAVFVALKAMKKVSASLEESRAELSENMIWLKSLLTADDSPEMETLEREQRYGDYHR